MLNLSYYVATVLLAIIVTTLTMLVVAKAVIYPTLISLFEDKYTTAEGAIKKGMSAMGRRSVQVKKESAMLEDISEAVLERYPEISAVAERISPDLVAMIEDDPETALILAERYLPTLKRFFPEILKDFGKEDPQSKLTWEF